jgi:hypothetical protein
MAKPETPQKPSKRPTSRKQPAAIPKQPEQQQTAAKPKIGRPSKYTPEIAQKMCEMLAEGIPLRQICRQEGFPEWRTVYDWMYKDDALGERGTGLSAAIAKAREIGQDAIAEQLWVDMLQEPERILSEGGGRIDPGFVQWQKAKAEIGLKLLAKWNPKRYGDRVALAGDADSPIKIEAETQADRLINALLQNAELRKQSESR